MYHSLRVREAQHPSGEAAGCSPSLLQVVEFLLWLHYCVGQEIANGYVKLHLICQARNVVLWQPATQSH